MMKQFAGAFVAALISIGATVASAATITLEATITGITGSAALLSELGITDGTARARVTFDADVSSGATLVDDVNWKFDYLKSNYSAFSLIAPAMTINAVASDGANHYVFTKDGIEDRTLTTDDVFEVSSFPTSSDPGLYYRFSILALDSDKTKWSRADPITADILNSFSRDDFVFEKYIGTSRESIRSRSVTWAEVAEVAVVPLPASLPLLIGALGTVALMRRRRRG